MITLPRLACTILLVGWCIVLACGERISASVQSSNERLPGLAQRDLQDDPISNLTETTELYDGYGGACQLVKQFDPSLHKEVYRVGVLAIRGFDEAYAEFNATFSEYLTATAGQRFDPPIRFEMVALDFETLFSDTSAGLVDFIYVNPSAFSCIESEFEAYSLASQVSLRKVNGVKYDLKKFGGVIAARADNDRVNTIRDIEGTIVAAASISGLGSGQLQFLEMHKAGMNYLNDPKQLVFTSNQGKVVSGLLNGEFDVGFIRTDQLESSVDADGNPVDVSLFKVIDPLPKLEIDGTPFPFPSSTPLYPEWNIAALTHVPVDVSTEVQEAMFAMADHGRIGARLDECYTQFNTSDYCDTLPFPSNFTTSGSSEKVRCDTSKEVALIAFEAMATGKFSSWQSSLSYLQLRSMQEAIGFISKDDQGAWQCIRSTKVYESVTCPPGQFLKSLEEFERSCSDAGLECKEGYQCVCQPCYEPTYCINSIKIRDNCVAYSVFLSALLVPIALLSFGTILAVVWYKSTQQVNQAEKAAQNERELNDFIAHEIRNPLTAALSASTFLNSALHGKFNPSEKECQSLREDAAIVDGSLRFINDLLRSMLDVHKAASKKMTLEYSQVGLHEDIFEFVSSMIYTRDTKFQVEIDCPRNLMVQTDKLRFQQVVLNLARNSAKFVDEGFIRLRADVINGSVQVFIEDSGPGIPEDKRDNLFSRFQQSLDSLAQGTGVGLNLCKYLVELMGGEIYLDDSYDSGYKGHPGARIVINLKQAPDHISDPITLASDQDEPDIESSAAFGNSRQFSSALDERLVALPEGMSVLFVDDDRILRKQGVRALERIAPSWKCREATSGETALQIVEEESFDFIFMDQYMTSVEQSMKGTETVRALRARGVKSIIIGLSGNDMREAFLSAGAETFHLKPLPCRENELRKVLVELFELKEAQVHSAEANTAVLSSLVLHHDDEA